MTLVDVFFAAAVLGGWVIAPAALFAAIGALIWAGRRARRLARAARQWRRDTQHEPDSSQPQTPALIDQQPGMNLALADECELLWATPYDPQVGLDRLRNAIQKPREEET